MSFTDEEVLAQVDLQLTAMNAELGDDKNGEHDVFARFDGTLFELVNAGRDRAYASLPLITPYPTEGKTASSYRIELQLGFIYATTPGAVGRLMRDGDRVRRAFAELREVDGIVQVIYRYVPLDFELIPNGIAVTHEAVVEYRRTDPARPRVVETTPDRFATGVAGDAALEIRFDRPMDTTTTEAAAVLADGAGDPVSMTASWANGNRVLTLTPDAPLGASIHVLSIAKTATSATGRPIRSAFELRFEAA